MVDDHVLHLVQSQLVTFINEGDEVLVSLLVAVSFGKVQAHERDEREHVGDRQMRSDGRNQQTSEGREAQGRKNAACRQGCRLVESKVGRGRALVASANHRAAHVSCDGPPSSRMSVGAVRM